MKASKGQKTASTDERKEHHAQDKTMSLSDYKKMISNAKGFAMNNPAAPKNGHMKDDGRSER